MINENNDFSMFIAKQDIGCNRKEMGALIIEGITSVMVENYGEDGYYLRVSAGDEWISGPPVSLKKAREMYSSILRKIAKHKTESSVKNT